MILAAVAVALAASRYLRRHLDTAAMLRCFGASRRQTLALFVLQFGALGLAASAAGIVRRARRPAAAGDAARRRSRRPTCRRPASLPALTAFGTGVLLLFGFALPPLVALAGVPPLRVLRRDLPRPRPGGVVAYLLGAGGDRAADRLAGAGREDRRHHGRRHRRACSRPPRSSAWLLIVLLKRLPQRGVTWRFGLANLRRRPLASSLQIGALALGLMALLLLTVVRGDLMQNWRASLPPDAPNHFVINVLPDQVDGVRAALQVGDRSATAALSDDPRPARRGQRQAARHRATTPTRAPGGSPSASSTCPGPRSLPKTNRVVAGSGSTARPAPAAGISMEEGIAESLKLKLGDTLTYDIAGTPVTREDHEPAQGRLGQLPAEFLRAVRARGAGVDAADLSRRGPAAGRCAVRRMALCAGAAVSERARDRRRRDHAPGAGDHRAGVEGGRVRVPVHAAGRTARPAGGDRGDAGRAPLRRRDPAHAGRVARAVDRRADRRVPRPGVARGIARRRGRDSHRLRAVRSRLPDPVLGESDRLAHRQSAAAR